MYAGEHARTHPDRPAFVMATSGISVSYAEFDARTNRLAHLLRAHGLQRLGHYSIFMENNDRFIEACGAGERTGLYYTCVNSYLTADELAYILQNSESRLLVTSGPKLEVALKAIAQCPAVTLCLVVGGETAAAGPAPAHCRVADYASELARFPATPIADERLGTPMLYSSGTTGRPKGVLRPLPDNPPSEPLPSVVARGLPRRAPRTRRPPSRSP